MKKRYYNAATHEWYTEGNSLTRRVNGALFSGVPSVEQLTAWGFEEWVEPKPTPAELLERAKASKIAELEAYDQSDAVDSFTIGGKQMWLDHTKREQLRVSVEAYQATGATEVTKWFDGVEYSFTVSAWLSMLNLLEVYASEALNVTDGHRAAIESLLTVNEVEGYDYTTGYPSRLVF